MLQTDLGPGLTCRAFDARGVGLRELPLVKIQLMEVPLLLEALGPRLALDLPARGLGLRHLGAALRGVLEARGLLSARVLPPPSATGAPQSS